MRKVNILRSFQVESRLFFCRCCSNSNNSPNKVGLSEIWEEDGVESKAILFNVGAIISYLLSDDYQAPYQNWRVSAENQLMINNNARTPNSHHRFESPEKELFIWALLFNKRNLAQDSHL